jgi:hypothetical protein
MFFSIAKFSFAIFFFFWDFWYVFFNCQIFFCNFFFLRFLIWLLFSSVSSIFFFFIQRLISPYIPSICICVIMDSTEIKYNVTTRSAHFPCHMMLASFLPSHSTKPTKPRCKIAAEIHFFLRSFYFGSIKHID